MSYRREEGGEAMKEYPICPRCHKQSVAGAHMISNDRRSLYCTEGNCSYDIQFEELTTPILRDESTDYSEPYFGDREIDGRSEQCLAAEARGKEGKDG